MSSQTPLTNVSSIRETSSRRVSNVRAYPHDFIVAKRCVVEHKKTKLILDRADKGRRFPDSNLQSSFPIL